MATAFQRLVRAARARATQAFDRFVLPFERGQIGDSTPFLHVTLAQAEAEEQQRRRQAKQAPEGEYGDIPIQIWADWTVRSIRAAVLSHATGQFGQAGLLSEGMLADDRVQAAVNGRTKGVTKCDAMLRPAPMAGGKEVAEEIADLWVDMFPEDILEQLFQWTIFMGFALAEIIWEPRFDSSRWFPRLKVWHPLTIFYDISTRQYVAITTEGPIYVGEDDPKWFLYTPYGSYRGWLRGAVRSVSIPWVVRQYALRDWARFSEKHGLPMVVGKYPAQAPAEDKARFLANLRNLGAETTLALPQQGGADGMSWDALLLEAKDTSWKAFPGLRDACDSAITLAIRGTNLTTEVDGGSYAAATAHRDEDSDFAIADRKKFAGAIKRQLLDLYAFYNYGKQELAPSLRFQAPKLDRDENPVEEAKTLLDLSNAVEKLEQRGWPIDRVALSEKYGIPLREDADPNQEPEPQSEPGMGERPFPQAAE